MVNDLHDAGNIWHLLFFGHTSAETSEAAAPGYDRRVEDQ
jgi:hypothetical protein